MPAYPKDVRSPLAKGTASNVISFGRLPDHRSVTTSDISVFLKSRGCVGVRKIDVAGNYAFVDFKSVDDARYAVKRCNGARFFGVTLAVNQLLTSPRDPSLEKAGVLLDQPPQEQWADPFPPYGGDSERRYDPNDDVSRKRRWDIAEPLFPSNNRDDRNFGREVGGKFLDSEFKQQQQQHGTGSGGGNGNRGSDRGRGDRPINGSSGAPLFLPMDIQRSAAKFHGAPPAHMLDNKMLNNDAPFIFVDNNPNPPMFHQLQQPPLVNNPVLQLIPPPPPIFLAPPNNSSNRRPHLLETESFNRQQQQHSIHQQQPQNVMLDSFNLPTPISFAPVGNVQVSQQPVFNVSSGGKFPDPLPVAKQVEGGRQNIDYRSKLHDLKIDQHSKTYSTTSTSRNEEPKITQISSTQAKNDDSKLGRGSSGTKSGDKGYESSRDKDKDHSRKRSRSKSGGRYSSKKQETDKKQQGSNSSSAKKQESKSKSADKKEVSKDDAVKEKPSVTSTKESSTTSAVTQQVSESRNLAYGKALAERLDKMTEKQQAFARMKIEEALFAAEFGSMAATTNTFDMGGSGPGAGTATVGPIPVDHHQQQQQQQQLPVGQFFGLNQPSQQQARFNNNDWRSGLEFQQQQAPMPTFGVMGRK